jgi:cyclopropane-fatty-acyl-phospholipid synthase
MNANTRTGSRRNIAYHYDLGNAFYGEWLDPGMLYSSALFEDGANSLEAAQEQKCRRLLGLLEAKPGEHVLEIGCGWGGFACLAAKERGVKVTGITISQEQHDFAKARVQREGLAEKVDIRMVDYRDLAGRYDHVASIEMFEAVGEEYWGAFFHKVRDSLRAGGRAALQIITIDDRLFETYRRGVDFIQKYIFPGGMLPSIPALRRDTGFAGLNWLSDTGFGQHYARTLGVWRERFNEAWPVIQKMGFDERFRRMWNLYLAYCEGGFRAGNIDVVQVQLGKG